MLAITDEEDTLEINDMNYTTALKEAKYEETTSEEVAKLQTHLSGAQQTQLAAVLSINSKLFSNKLDVYPQKKIIWSYCPIQCQYMPSRMLYQKVNEEVFKK